MRGCVTEARRYQPSLLGHASSHQLRVSSATLLKRIATFLFTNFFLLLLFLFYSVFVGSSRSEASSCFSHSCSTSRLAPDFSRLSAFFFFFYPLFLSFFFYLRACYSAQSSLLSRFLRYSVSRFVEARSSSRVPFEVFESILRLGFTAGMRC